METLQGFSRSNYCGVFSAADIGKKESVCGWVQRMRNLGGLIFIDLRDRTGIVQCTFDSSIDKELFLKAFTVRAEWVLAISGTVRGRGEGAVNIGIPTGEVEILASQIRILSVSETPPFEILPKSDVNDMLRLKYRYLDLRRPDMQAVIALRHRAAQITRRYFDEQGFFEIETPMLTKSTPEGARDYIVPSRVHPGKFYALPQSPQQYKQLLMLSGFDRYFQIVRCFRDEDLRADRQPEFTQIDLEMSFVDIDDVITVNENFLKTLFKETIGACIETPFLRMPYSEAMNRFGSDKPDMRFGFELCDISDIVKSCGFKVFSEPCKNGGTVRLINIAGYSGSFTRKDIDALTEHAKTYKAKGLAWIKTSMGEMTSSFAKFMTDKEMNDILSRAGAGDNDLILIVADSDSETVMTALGALRIECAKRLNLLKSDDYKFLWVIDFPLFEYSEEDGRYLAKHHPFTAPMDEDVELMEKEPGKCRAKAYDVILNGTELGGGSIRIFNTELQERMFNALGFTPESARAEFGHLLDAFSFGAPPHGGLAYGFDRLIMLLAGASSIRDVIAFPKVQNASEPLTMCPDTVDSKQLEELGIKLV